MSRAAAFLLLAACGTAREAEIRLASGAPEETAVLTAEFVFTNPHAHPVLPLEIEFSSDLAGFPRRTPWTHARIPADGWKISEGELQLAQHWMPGDEEHPAAARVPRPPLLDGEKPSPFVAAGDVVLPGKSLTVPVTFQAVSLRGWENVLTARLRYAILRSAWHFAPDNPPEATSYPGRETKVIVRYVPQGEFSRAVVEASSLEPARTAEARLEATIRRAGAPAQEGAVDVLYWAPEKRWVFRTAQGIVGLKSDVFLALRRIVEREDEYAVLEYESEELEPVLGSYPGGLMKGGGWARRVPPAEFWKVVEKLESAGWRVDAGGRVGR